MQFYVTPNQAKVDNFAISINVSGCGGYIITNPTPVAIKNRKFAFGGGFFASGTFDSVTTAHGKAGLVDYYYIPGCGYIYGGSFSWTAFWINGNQPILFLSPDSNTTFTVVPESDQNSPNFPKVDLIQK
jgi:hypothetical protein